MNRLFRSAAAVMLAVAATVAADAMPARQGLTVMTQSDGTRVSVNIYGDEYRCMYLSADGYLLLADADGDLCYAIASVGGQGIVASDMKATDESDRPEAVRQALASVDKDEVIARYCKNAAARSSDAARSKAAAREKINDYPSIGQQKVLVILARFADVDFHTPDPKTAISRMLNESGYADNGADGSVRDYFVDNSEGKYQPEMVVYGPVTLPQNMAYYGAPSASGATDSHPEEMIRDACLLLDDEIDFREYDLDDDGYIDNVYLFYPGYSQADGASVNTIWPHAGYSWSKLRAEFDGMRLDRYACSNEIDLETGKLVSIGTFCHEFSHVLGLPDLYSTDYSNEAHPGTWSLMATGGRNNGGKTPPCLSAYERYSLGWLEPDDMVPSENVVTLDDVASSNKAFILRTGSDNEYFIVENRQQHGWDSYLPGHGMLIWHIDYDAAAWTGNQVNNDGSHQRIDLVEADGSFYSDSRAGDSFPGSADVRSITDDTTPSLKSWDYSRRNIGLYNIAETKGGQVEFNVFDSTGKLPAVVTAEASDITPISFQCNWELVPGATSYMLEVYSKIRVGSVTLKNYVEGYRLYRTGDVGSVIVNDLEPETDYYYVVRAMGGTRIGDYSEERQVRTLDKDFRFFAPETAAATEVTGTSFTANWKPMEGAVKYFVSVYELERTDSEVRSHDFTGDVLAPVGWSVSAGCATNSWYYGEAKPGLSMTGNYYVQSPLDDRDVALVRFWYRGLKSGQDDVNEIRVLGYCDGEWILLHKVSPLSVESTGEIVEVGSDMIDRPCHAVRIEYYRPYGSGTVILDDIKVEYVGSTATVLSDYDGTGAGQELKLHVSGLKPETFYRYEVKASDGILDSRVSGSRIVRTLESSGIDAVPSVGSAVSLDGDALVVDNTSHRSASMEVYDISGQLLCRRTVAAGSRLRWTLPAHGVYIARLDGHAFKVMY